MQGRNRRCITVDMRTEKGRDIIKRLASNVDVLVENFRPGVMEKWGLGPQASILNCGLKNGHIIAQLRMDYGFPRRC